ncbi:hypothetical protein [Paraburkholderia sp. Ac-20342]|uniref:hypothetical protein n=1 Tax=Paraburkholderia sp. Ac-20342 TaxID=2703889 RepID=UPI001F11A6F3|nr:hypothetical protein [Paraburkholderia sp. Ac-20342]
MDSQVAQPSMTLWIAIDTLAQQIPFSRNKVENTLSTHLVKGDTSKNPIQNTAFQFYTGSPVRLADGITISNVDLRIRHRPGHPGFLVLNLGGSCTTLDAVREHYRDLRITEHPHGHSLDEATSYSAFLEWGKLSFGFLERNRNCLAYVVLNPKYDADNIAQ